MANYSAGSASISIGPSLAGFVDELKTRLQSIDEKFTVGIQPADISGFASDLQSELARVNANIDVEIKPADISGFAAELDAELQRVNADVNVRIVPDDITTFVADLDAQLGAVSADIDVRISPDFTGFIAQLEAFAAASAFTIPVRVVPDFSGLNDGITNHNPPPIRITGNVDAFQADLVRRLDTMSREAELRIPLTADGERMRAGLRAQVDELQRQLRMNISVDPEIGARQRAYLRAQIEQLERSIEINIPVDTRSTGQRLASMFAGAASSAGELGSSAAAAGGPLKALAAISLLPLAASAAQAAGVIALLPAAGAAAGAGLGAIIIGSSGITDAFSAAKAAADDTTDSFKAQKSAQDQLETAQQGAARTAEQGARQIASAEEGVERAKQKSVDAEKKLTQARRDAVLQIRDMNDALRGSQLSEQEAQLALDRAREALTTFTPGETVNDRRGKVLDVSRAEFNLNEARKSREQQQQETDAANRGGVEGLQSVVDAKQGVVDATRAEDDAQKNLLQTQKDVAQSNADAAKQIVRAQESLTEALNTSSKAAEKLDEAMGKLSPNAKAFVSEILQLGEAWTDLKMAVQDNLFADLGTSVSQLANFYLPTLKTGFSGVATEINVGLRNALTGLQTEANKTNISTIFENTRQSIQPLIDGFANIGQGLLNIATVGSDFLPGLSTGFQGLTTTFVEWTERIKNDGSLKDFIQTAIDKFQQLSDIAGDIIGIIGDVAKALTTDPGGEGGGLGGDWLTSVHDAFDKWNQFLGSDEGQAKIRGFFEEIKRIVEGIVAAINTVAPFLGTFLPGTPQVDPATGKPVVDPKTGAPVMNDDAGTANRIWNADESGSWIGSIARGFNGILGYNNETKEYDGGLWKDWWSHPFSFGDWGSEDKPGDGSAPPSTGNQQTLERLGIEPGTVIPGGGGGGPGGIAGRSRSVVPGGDVDSDPAGWSEKWTGMVNTVANSWDNTLRPKFNELTGKLGDIGSGFLTNVKEHAGGAWDGLTSGVSSGWTSISSNFESAKTGVGDLSEKFLSGITNGAVVHWGDLPSKIGSGVSDIRDNMFAKLHTGLDDLKTKFSDIVGGIGGVWDGIKSAMADPINWVISNVVNGGIGRLWSGVRKIIPSLGEWTDVGLIEAAPAPVKRAQGGGVWGPGGPTDDMIPAWLSNDEHVWTAAEVKAAGGHGAVEQMRRNVLGGNAGGPSSANYSTGGPARFAVGGDVQFGTDADTWMAKVIQDAFPDATVTSALRPGVSGFHGKGQAIDIDGPSKQAYADWIYSAYPQSEQLIWGPGPLLYNVGGNMITDQAQLANSVYAGDLPGHFDHVHWANDTPLGDLSDDEKKSLFERVKAGIGSAFSGARSAAASIFEVPLKAIGSTIPDFGESAWGKLPRGLYDSLSTAAIDFVRGQSSSGSGAPSDGGAFVGGGAEQWRPLVEKLFKEKGIDPGLVDKYLYQIQRESSGNPHAINNTDINAQNGTPSKGLAQVIDPTFQSYKDPGFDDIWDPESNLRASLNYLLRDPKFGGQGVAALTGAGYDQGGIANGIGFMPKMTLQPERVLSPDQTVAFDKLVESITGNAPGGSTPVLPGGSTMPATTPNLGNAPVGTGNPDQDFLTGLGQNFATKSLSILGNGALGFFGLENSVLSPSNVYNQAFQQLSQVRPGPPPNAAAALSAPQGAGAGVASTLPLTSPVIKTTPTQVTNDRSVTINGAGLDVNALMEQFERKAAQDAQAFLGTY